jgi:hypothetical protein
LLNQQQETQITSLSESKLKLEARRKDSQFGTQHTKEIYVNRKIKIKIIYPASRSPLSLIKPVFFSTKKSIYQKKIEVVLENCEMHEIRPKCTRVTSCYQQSAPAALSSLNRFPKRCKSKEFFLPAQVNFLILLTQSATESHFIFNQEEV